MNIALTAKLKTVDDFMAQYEPGDEQQLFSGQSLLAYALSNHDDETRFAIATFLLDKGARVDGEDSEKNDVFALLFSRPEQSFEHTLDLARRLIDAGADVNHLDKKGRDSLFAFITIPFMDDALEPLYELWFSQQLTNIEHVDSFGFTPKSMAEKRANRPRLIAHMEEYLAGH